MTNPLFSGFLLLFLLVAPTSAALGDDGEWDYDKGGTDRDVDNDGEWDYDKGGTDRDLDNDGQWDYSLGGFDRDVDNDGEWDYDKGGTDRGLDNDGQWDYNLGVPTGMWTTTTDGTTTGAPRRVPELHAAAPLKNSRNAPDFSILCPRNAALGEVPKWS